MFCGHDHYSDFVALRRGVYLCYGRVSSYTPPRDWEGSGGPLAFAPGGRVVEWKANQKELQSWIEIVGGEEAASRVMLDLSHHDNEVSTNRRSSWLAAACVVLGALGYHYYM